VHQLRDARHVFLAHQQLQLRATAAATTAARLRGRLGG
jgi:hypothetical protein